MAELALCEDTLALFTEGIAGRYFHIKTSAEFTNHRRLNYRFEEGGQAGDAIYLPEQIDAPDNNCYKVLVMEQLGLRECGTYHFRMQTALERTPALRASYIEPRGTTARTGDLQLLFGTFTQPSLAADIFNLFEKARVQAYLRRTYPGLQRHLNRYHEHLLLNDDYLNDPLSVGHRYTLGAADTPPQWHMIEHALDSLARPQADVYSSVKLLCDLYNAFAECYVFDEPQPYSPQEESLPDWLNREQRIDEWDEKLEQLNELVMDLDLFEAEDLEAQRGESNDATVREADVDIKSLIDERDTLKRRIDMEKSSVQHALGTDRSAARSYRYDEWDYLSNRYLTHWCRVYEEVLAGDDTEETEPLAKAVKDFGPVVRKQLEQIRPTGLQRISRVQDGDELDLNAIIEARQDIRSGTSPSERFYSRRERIHRDVCAIFLVDLSASTDDPIEPPEPQDWSDYDEQGEVNMRDPYFGPEDLDENDEDTPPPRKIIDVQREAMVVMASALDALGDSYGIYGFSGYGKDCVEVFVAKEPNQGFSSRTLQSIAAMKPKRSTRMGPAIRHSTHKLMQSGHAMKVLMVISDGFPQDSDYGPERGNHNYGVEDTARAITEAQQKGVETFCITVDRSGHDYLKRMCPDARYLVIEEMNDLPDQLTKVYTALTGR